MSLVAAACAPAPRGNPPSVQGQPTIDTSGSFAKGFELSEARNLLELCTALNNAADLPPDLDIQDWELLYPDGAIVAASAKLGPAPETMGPFGNAWRLYRRKTPYRDGKPVFAIVVRGTTAQQQSIAEDLIATSIVARPWIEADVHQYLSFTLARTPDAETHLGFTYGFAVVTFARNGGILKLLREQVPRGSKIYITGHSQGAAIATLVHAFLHYAINDESDRYGLRDTEYSLKSYFFAQPKPGNVQFAMDFARIAASHGTSFVINNNLDWVPQVPLTIEFIDEPGADLAAEIQSVGGAVRSTFRAALLSGAIGLAKATRALFARQGEGASIGKLQESHVIEPAYLVPGPPPPGSGRSSSINYVNAGNPVPVFGSGIADGAVTHDGWLTQHHALTYRKLLDQLENAATAETALDRKRGVPEAYHGEQVHDRSH